MPQETAAPKNDSKEAIPADVGEDLAVAVRVLGVLGNHRHGAVMASSA